MCEITIQVKCPHCHSCKVVKNGVKRTGRQNFLCRECSRQFQDEYRYRGADPAVGSLILRMLERNSGIRDIEAVLGVSRRCVLGTLCRRGAEADVKPSRRHYPSVQIDELWSFVGRRKKGKYWLIYAYSPDYDEILGYECGARSAKTVERLLGKLKEVEIDEYCTDSWKAFAKVLPAEKHRVGKEHTKNIEGVNTCLRARNRRLVRKTTCFSKKKENHLASINLMFSHRNRHKCRHHTL